MDYRIYRMNIWEKLRYGGIYMAGFFILSVIFYDLLWPGVIGIFAIPFLLKRKSKILAKQRRENLALSFKEFILSFSSSMKSGHSVENAFIAASQDLCLAEDEKSDMVTECEKICRQLQNNMVLEELLSEFAERSGQRDIRDFTAVFNIAKRSGGNLGAVIQNTSYIISEKIEVKREIELMFAAKRTEAGIMNLVPVGIIGYIRMTSPGYFDCLYHSSFGVFFMSFCLLICFFTFFVSQKFMNIEV